MLSLADTTSICTGEVSQTSSRRPPSGRERSVCRATPEKQDGHPEFLLAMHLPIEAAGRVI